MKAKGLLATASILVSVAWAFGYAQNDHSNSAREKREFAVNLVRVINTAEAQHRGQAGNFVGWPDLASTEPFTKAKQRHPQLRDLNLATDSTVAPGWELRLFPAPDRQSYVVVLIDKTDESCAYSVLSDEKGLIREGKAIGCQKVSND